MRLPTVFIADEVGALANRYPIDAMQSGQMNIKNRSGILISTAYDSKDNPMTNEIDIAKKVLDGEIEDKTLFPMLYMPDNPEMWQDSDEELLKANPLAIELPDTFEFLKKQRFDAINDPLKQPNFLTKHMNIFIQGSNVEAFVNDADMDMAETTDPIDWAGKNVYLGVDLAETNDNTSVSMVSYDYDTQTFFAKSWAFLPGNRVAPKSKIEKINYAQEIDNGNAFPSGENVIDYSDIESFILRIEDTYHVHVLGVGYDKWNARSSMNKISKEGYDTIEVMQSVQGVYPGSKLLRESIVSDHFKFETNYLYRMNFLNAKMITNSDLSYKLNKKQSEGKIDMVASTVDAMALWNDAIDEGRGKQDALEDIPIFVI